jgi:2-C-methyl-D-erythritol 2,4-cyclodiphosphate synthase
MSATDNRYRVGIGHDTHRLGAGGPLILGGVAIPHDRHAIGHSDADVLLHAVIDALLGAAALGDIGELFPDTEDANRGRDSAQMVHTAVDCLRRAGYGIVNLDCIVFAQRPRLSDHKGALRERIAHLVGTDVGSVSVKAKTGEQVGTVGTEQAIAAQCIALVEPLGP